MCVCVCSVAMPFILDVWLVDKPAGVTQEERHTGFLHLPSAVPALLFIARRVQSFVPFPRRPSSRILCTNEFIFTCWAFFFFFIVMKNFALLCITCGSSCSSSLVRQRIYRGGGLKKSLNASGHSELIYKNSEEG